MLQAALEALKKQEQEDASKLSPKKPSEIFFDDDDRNDGELANLLNEIEQIGSSSLEPAQSNKQQSTFQLKATFDDKITFSSSEIDLFDANPPPILTGLKNVPGRPAVEALESLAQATRSTIGIAPDIIAASSDLDYGPNDDSIRNLPLPMHPEGITGQAILRNIEVLSANGVFDRLQVNPGDRLIFSQIRQLEKLSKVRLVIGAVGKQIEQICKDFLVDLIDDTGDVMQATIHEAAIRDSRIKLHPGLLLVLANLSQFRPTAKIATLVVVPRNLVGHFTNYQIVSES